MKMTIDKLPMLDACFTLTETYANKKNPFCPRWWAILLYACPILFSSLCSFLFAFFLNGAVFQNTVAGVYIHRDTQVLQVGQGLLHGGRNNAILVRERLDLL